MNINKGLAFNKHTGKLTGIVDHGNVNANLECAFAGVNIYAHTYITNASSQQSRKLT